jgi:hypothetical protein
VKLPKFRFDALFIPNNYFTIPFDKKMNGNFFINLDEHENEFKEFKELKHIPKFISLCSNKSGWKQIFLAQQFTQIKVRFLDNKNFKKKVYDIIKLSDFECSFFIPFKR